MNLGVKEAVTLALTHPLEHLNLAGMVQIMRSDPKQQIDEDSLAPEWDFVKIFLGHGLHSRP